MLTGIPDTNAKSPTPQQARLFQPDHPRRLSVILCFSVNLGFSVILGVLAAILPATKTIAADRFAPIDLREVNVGGEIGRRIDGTVHNNLLVLDADKDFLQPFKDRNRSSGYIGLGKLIDSLVRFAAYTNDEKVLALKKHVVSEIIKTQESDGYIGLFVPEARMWKLWDVHEMSYLVLGLSADHRYFGEEASLEAARKLADHIITRWQADPQKKPGEGSITVHMAVTGIGSAMLALYEQTGDSRYLDFCTTFRKIPDWDYPIVRGRWGPIGGHVYTFLSRCVAQLRLHRIQPDDKLLRQTHKALDFLTKRNGMVLTGSCGDHECWHDTQSGTHNLAETCATAYMIRWLDNLLRLEGDPRYGDLMERAVYNALFAAQSPDGRHIRYYSPFDGPRTYFKGDTYCCPGNFRRIIAELPTMIYYRADGGLAVNLYAPSEARVALADNLSLNVRQVTDYPNSGEVRLHLDPSKPAEFPIQLRIPRWAAKAELSVNGKPVDEPARSGSFIALKRKWKKGDKITLRMPMPWRLVKGRQAQAGRVAVMRGPTVFCLNPARNKKLANIDLRLITLDPTSVEGPFRDEAVRPDGMACKVRAWGPGAWYPQAKPDLTITLTEFPDPDGQATYFQVPNPGAKELVDDELMQPEEKGDKYN